MTPEVLDAALATVRRFFQIIVLDLPPGAGIKNETCRWAYGAVDEALVVTTPTKATVDYQLRHILEFLRESYEELPLHVALNVVPRPPGPERAGGAGDRRLDPGLADGCCACTATTPWPARSTRRRSTSASSACARAVDIKRLAANLAEGWCR